MKLNIFWFRRDLRLEDNTALDKALASGMLVLPVFIFDTNITDELSSDDSLYQLHYWRWVGNIDKSSYPEKMVDHDFARQRALTAYKTGLKKRII